MIVLLYGRLDSINAIIFVTICSKNLGVPGELCFILVRVRVIYLSSFYPQYAKIKERAKSLGVFIACKNSKRSRS